MDGLGGTPERPATLPEYFSFPRLYETRGTAEGGTGLTHTECNHHGGPPEEGNIFLCSDTDIYLIIFAAEQNSWTIKQTIGEFFFFKGLASYC